MTKQKTANKIEYVERWIIHFGKDKKYDGVSADQLPNGKWLCEIELPLVGQKIQSKASTEINAMLRASEKATKAIQEYLKNHQDVKWMPLSKVRHWKIGYGEFGYVELGLDSEYRKKTGEKLLKIQDDSIKAVEKAIARIDKVAGVGDDLYIQVLDRSLFDKDASDDEIFKKIFDTLYYKHNIYLDNIHTINNGKRIIIVGYTMPRKEYDEQMK